MMMTPATRPARPLAQQQQQQQQALAPTSASQLGLGMGGVTSEILAFMKQERDDARADRAALEAQLQAKDAQMLALLTKHHADVDAQKDQQLRDALAELDGLRKENASLRDGAGEGEGEGAAVPAAAVSEAQLGALQARLVSLHDASLLSDDELFTVRACIHPTYY
jgi:hypothetical protein